MDKTIIVLEGANEDELEQFKVKLANDEELVLTNKDCKLFKLVEGELFEVVTSLVKARKDE